MLPSQARVLAALAPKPAPFNASLALSGGQRCDFPRVLNRGSIGIWPLIPFVILIYKALFPWPYRKHAWQIVVATVTAPSVVVAFNQNFVGDVLTSLVPPPTTLR